MKFNKEDQNTFLMILAILIVCIITLVVVFNGVWLLIREPLNYTMNNLNHFFKSTVQSYDYNFQVPPSSVKAAEAIKVPEVIVKPTQNNPQDQTQTNTQDSQQNKNTAKPFELPVVSQEEIAQLKRLPDYIIFDAKKLGYGLGQETSQVRFSVEIPKLKINSPAISGTTSSNLLEKGFWIAPDSKLGNSGEIILLCYRRYFGTDNPKSCLFLDKIELNDEINIKTSQTSIKYSVVGINEFNENDPLIYKASDNNYLKIVTVAPIDGNQKRLVILAKKVF